MEFSKQNNRKKTHTQIKQYNTKISAAKARKNKPIGVYTKYFNTVIDSNQRVHKYCTKLFECRHLRIDRDRGKDGATVRFSE